jgi:hypothetical protein
MSGGITAHGDLAPNGRGRQNTDHYSGAPTKAITTIAHTWRILAAVCRRTGQCQLHGTHSPAANGLRRQVRLPKTARSTLTVGHPRLRRAIQGAVHCLGATGQPGIGPTSAYDLRGRETTGRPGHGRTTNYGRAPAVRPTDPPAALIGGTAPSCTGDDHCASS